MKKISVILSLAFFILLACSSENSGIEITKTAKDNFKLLPAESNLVMYCDFSKIHNTPFAKQILEEFHTRIKETDEDFDEFKRATGLDPERDFHNILVGSILAENRRDQNFFVIINGVFNDERIVAYVREKAETERRGIPWEEQEIAGHTVYISKEDRTEISLCFIDKKTLYVGPYEWMKEALQGTLAESLADRPEYIASIDKNVKYGDQIWLVLDTQVMADRSSSFASELRRNVPAFDRVQSVVLSAKANSELDFSGKLLCDSKESGEVMVDLMKGALAAAKLAVSNEREKVDELNRIKIYLDGNVAVLHGELTESFFKTLKEHRFYKPDRL